MTLWRLKGCPRCAGDVFVTEDSEGGYEQCLQCAWQRPLAGRDSRPAESTEEALSVIA